MAGLRPNRSWRLLWAGSTASALGDFVFDTTMVLWIGTVVARGQSWAPAAVSGVLIAASVPAIFLGPVAGVFADRWNHRRTLLTADACRAVLMLVLLPLAWETPADFFAEFRAGLRFFATNRVLLALAIGAVIATLGTGGINALNVFCSS